LGLILTTQEQYDEARQLIEPLLSEELKPAPTHDLLWLVGSLIDAHKPMHDLAERIYDYALEKTTDRTTRDFKYSLKGRICNFMAEIGNKARAREMALEAIKHEKENPQRRPGNEEYEAYQQIRSTISMIEFLDEIDYPADARMGFARLARPDACLAVQGKGFKGQARGPDYEGLLRYEEVDRWNPIPVAEHPYDLELCDLCVRQCPIEIRIAQCEAGKPPSGDPNQCPPRHAITLEPVGEGTAKLPVITDGCVGCGVCEMICPVEPTVIVIDLDKTADTLNA